MKMKILLTNNQKLIKFIGPSQSHACKILIIMITNKDFALKISHNHEEVVTWQQSYSDFVTQQSI